MYYNANYKKLNFRVENKNYIKLHRECKLSQNSFKKLSQQIAESFRIVKKIENFAYELEIFQK